MRQHCQYFFTALPNVGLREKSEIRIFFSQCNAAVGVKAFFDMMHSGPHKLMLFGAACTHVTDPIAKASKHWHLTQLSYADTHPMFTKENFPNFFRIVPSENAFNSPRLSLLKEFNWTKKIGPETNCTLEELESALEQTILTDLLPLSTSGEITVSGITATEYKMEYDSRRGVEYS
ncbi:hypothetical protein NQ318_005717, partial [Aromia moschata]